MAVQQAPGISRLDLQQHDLSVPGREVIQNRVEIGYVVEKGKPFLVLVE